jgi:hypothetical protein
MCHGRLSDGLEPACVNACPEAAIEIEIVNQLEWRSDHAAGNAPGMPNAGVTISTTRITLPENAHATLERVDMETLRPEHPHWSLVWMTSLIQLSAGTLVAALLSHHDRPIALALVLALTAFTLNISVLHVGRPAYAWRALKMWRRSWLSPSLRPLPESSQRATFFLSPLCLSTWPSPSSGASTHELSPDSIQTPHRHRHP